MQHKATPLVLVLSALLLASGSVSADIWDTATNSDDTRAGTGNELSHGSIQTHDAGARPGPVPDEDFYLVRFRPYSSFEIVVDGLNLDMAGAGSGLNAFRTDSSGTVLASATSQELRNRSLRVVNNTSTDVNSNYIRVSGAGCAAFCDAGDQYRIRMAETTLSLARFNNTGTQITVLIVQNPLDVSVTVNSNYWNSSGTLLTTLTNTIAARSSLVFNASTDPNLAGQTGSITITNDAPYGVLNAKAVALESSTGYSFDTPGVYRAF